MRCGLVWQWQSYPNVIGTCTSELLTINIQSRSTCDHSCWICGNAWVLSFVVGENSGNLQLTGFTIMRHLEDVWLSDLSVITEPRNLQIWRHIQSASGRNTNNTWHLSENLTGQNLFETNNQDKMSCSHYLPQRRCTGTGQDVPLRPGRPSRERWGPEQRPERFRQLQELQHRQDDKNIINDGIGHQSIIIWFQFLQREEFYTK